MQKKLFFRHFNTRWIFFPSKYIEFERKIHSLPYFILSYHRISLVIIERIEVKYLDCDWSLNGKQIEKGINLRKEAIPWQNMSSTSVSSEGEQQG
jgi:hypothetical protein